MESRGLLRLILILGGLAALGPLSIDMYLPALPAIERDLATDAASAQLTLSAYFIGLAFGQLVYGPLSDRIGRKPPLLFGLALFTAASVGCALATSVEALIALRLLQALGGCAGMVVSRAVVRDRYGVEEMARILSLLVLVMGVAPILAPSLGGLLYTSFGWQSIFLLLAATGAASFVAVWCGIDESLSQRSAALSVAGVARGYLRILGHRRFMGYALSGGLAQAGMFAYIAASPFVFIEYFGLSPQHYGWLFGANAFGLIASSQANAALLGRFRSEKVLRGALNVFFVCACALLVAALTHAGGIWGVVAPLFGCMTALGMTFPNSAAGAMAPFGDRAGTASALLGTLQFGAAALASVAVGVLHGTDASAMAGVIAACGLFSQCMLRWLVRPPKAAAAELARKAGGSAR